MNGLRDDPEPTPARDPHASPLLVATTGRLAPSPTGDLHLGNLRTFLWAWLSARASGGTVRLRMEDLDGSRARADSAARQVDDLSYLSLDWDGPVTWQSERRPLYRAAFERLRPHLYACGCTRAAIAALQSAPHEGEAEVRYPGTCRGRAPDGSGRVAWRLRVEPGEIEFEDRLFGRQAFDVATTVGDFVVARSAAEPAYQLAVVVDDIAQGVTEVVRGDDLLPSTARQILLYRLLGATPPRFGHVPLVVGSDGKRLAKRHASATLAALRSAGVPAERIVAALARWSGLPQRARPVDLVPDWSWDRVSRERVVLTPERMAELVG